jgi:opacity protein-like surface antigen
MLKRLILLLVLITLSSSVFAQRFNKQGSSYGSRDDRFEASLLLNYQSSVSKDLEEGSSLDIDSSAGWGFTLGWNWSSKWNTAYKFSMNKPDYTAVIVPENPDLETQTLNYKMSKITHQFNATYNFFDKPLTPFVQAGVGITTLDSNVPDQPPVTGCWWDPWWGYVCTTTWSTYKTTKFSYNAGIGLRWDVNNAFYMRGSYNKEWVSVDSGSLSFNTFTLEAGLMF